MSAATIKLFLLDGVSTGLRTGEISNWSGVAVAGPRNDLGALLDRPELSGAGVYFLIGHDPYTGRSLVYVGEAETLRDRLRQQTQEDYWVQAIIFTSKDENLSKGHIRYLEGEILKLAKSAGRAVLKNSKSSGARLSESDKADMGVFLERVQQLLPVLGSDLLVSKGKIDSPNVGQLYCKIKGFKATGRLTNTGFLVYKGSQSVLSTRPSAGASILALRKRLVNEGVLQPNGDHYIFARDEEFSSPSYAAAAVRGGNSAGPTEWKDSKGRTLKQIEQS